MIGEWISVKDRLPEKRGQYLCYTPIWYGGKIIHRCIAVYTFIPNAEDDADLRYKGVTGPAWTWYDSEYGTVNTDSVTYWAHVELPEED